MRDTLLAAASRCAIGRICLKPTLAVTDLNDRHWSTAAGSERRIAGTNPPFLDAQSCGGFRSDAVEKAA